MTEAQVLQFARMCNIIDETNTVPETKDMEVNKTGTLRKDGRYMCYAHLSTGRKAAYGKTEEEAIKKAVELERQELTEQEHKKYAFERNYRIWFNQLDIKPQSKDRIEVTYNKYFKDTIFATKDVRFMDSKYIAEFLNQILVSEGSMQTKAFAKITQIIRETLYYMDEPSILLDWEKVKRKLSKTRLISTDKEEFAIEEEIREVIRNGILVEQIFDDKYSSGLCWLIAESLGTRVGELAVVTWKDIDFSKQVLSITKTEVKYYERDKNGNRIGKVKYKVSDTTKTPAGVREIPLTPRASELLQLLLEHHKAKGWYREEQYLCYNGKKMASLSKALARDLGILCKRLNLSHINTHLIRKTFATELHDANIPTKTISYLLGHKDISTTEKNYILHQKFNAKALREQMEKAI